MYRLMQPILTQRGLGESEVATDAGTTRTRRMRDLRRWGRVDGYSRREAGCWSNRHCLYEARAQGSTDFPVPKPLPTTAGI